MKKSESLVDCFEFIPKKRDKASVDAYKVLRWWKRKHRKEIQEKLVSGMKDAFLFGTGYAKVDLEK